jgi:hypothetical protein
MTDRGADTAAGRGTGMVLVTLASGQFVMTLDSSAMNVAIATVAKGRRRDGDRDQRWLARRPRAAAADGRGMAQPTDAHVRGPQMAATGHDSRHHDRSNFREAFAPQLPRAASS